MSGVAHRVLVRVLALTLLGSACIIREADPPANFQTPVTRPPCALGPGSADYEPIETRCDGIDNDCDGLTDVLLPVAENACTDAPGSCAAGYAACEGGARVCMAPGPSPEVYDGADNDCNGTVDDVPAVSAPSRALVLVPSYIWDEASDEVDTVGSILEQWGIPYDRSAKGSDWSAELAALPKYAVVLIPGYVQMIAMDATRQKALEDFARAGGVVVVTRPIENEEGGGFPLAGLAHSKSRLDVDTLSFDGTLVTATRAFDSPEERHVPVTDDVEATPTEAFIMEPSDASTQIIAHGMSKGVPVGAMATRRSIGRGAIYAIGHDLHSFGHTRCYVNCFEPSGDMLGLFVREALREGTGGHLVIKHTVPGPEDSVMMLTHDVDAPDAQKPGSWGNPGAVQTADLEVKYKARGTFLITTDYVTPYYSEDMVRTLCAKGMCPLGAHSVLHADNFAKQPEGTCQETRATYFPEVRTANLCGEVRIPKELIFGVTGSYPIAWRSPYLFVNPYLYDVLEQEGFVMDSSWGVGDLKFNLPVSAARTGLLQDTFHHRKVFTMPISVEDGIGVVENGVETRTEMQYSNSPYFVTLWSYAMYRNSQNSAYTMALLHPSYGRNVGADNLKYKLDTTEHFLANCVARGIKIDMTMGEIGTFWRGREATDLVASYDATSGYSGTLSVGGFSVENLTLEFGDVVKAFTCATCGSTEIHGRRVTILGALGAQTKHAFVATVH